MFYVCIATEKKPWRTMYAEHFVEPKDRDRRAFWLKHECYTHDGASWVLYLGDEPFEAAVARLEAPTVDGEILEDRQKRLDALALKAGKLSTSILTKPEIDDRAEEYRL